MCSATMTALQKPDGGGVRGIATGTSFRRLVAKCPARQFGKAVESCAPFQFALSTRAGTDCVGHVVRVLSVVNRRHWRVRPCAPERCAEEGAQRPGFERDASFYPGNACTSHDVHVERPSWRET